MNQSRKILAALVAVPASVVVADGALAAENTLEFTVKNDFVNGGSINVKNITKQDLNEDLANKVFEEMDKFNSSTFSYNLDISANTGDLSDLQYAKAEVQELFDYLKVNLHDITQIPITNGNRKLDNTLLYTLFDNVKVTATQVMVDNTKKVKLEFTFSYYVESDYTTVVNSIYNELALGSSVNKDISTVKKIHDYLINATYVTANSNELLSLASPKIGASPHLYSVWSYLLFKKARFEEGVRYVYGMSGGKRHSWNLVKIGNEWYNIDISNDDNTTQGSTFIQYKYFLTSDSIVGNREIYFGNRDNMTISSNDNFANIINPIRVGTDLYYVDISDSKLKKVNENNPDPIITISEDKTEPDKVVLYDNNTEKSLFFVNNSKGKQLYEYSITSTVVPTNPKLAVKTEVYSFKISGTDLTIYKSATDNIGMKISLVGGIDAGMANYVADVVKKIDLITPANLNSPTAQEQIYINKVAEALKLVTMLTPDQKQVFNGMKSDKDTINANETIIEYLAELESSLKSSDTATAAAVEEVVTQIKAIDIENPTYLDDVKAVQEKFNKLTEAQKKLVYNAGILTDAANLITKKTIVENKVYQFIEDYKNPVDRGDDFYSKLNTLIAEYEAIHPNLFTTTFKDVTIKALLTMGNSTIVSPIIKEIKDILQILNKEASNYLTKLRELKIKYGNLTLIQKRTLLTATENNTIQSKLTELEALEAVINKYVENKYITEINSINNDTNNLNPNKLDTTFVNKVIEINKLLAEGLLPSQWSEIVTKEGITPTPTLAQIQAKIDGFLDRVKIVQDLVVGKAPDAKKLIELFNADSYGTVQDFVAAVEKLESDLKGLVTDTTSGYNQEQFEILLTMINEKSYEQYKKYTEMSKVIEGEISQFETDIATLESKTSLTEVEVDNLIEAISKKGEIYKKFISNYTKLDTMKQKFTDQKDKDAAQTLILDIQYLLIKESPTYLETKALWDRYEAGTKKFKETVEAATTAFTDFKNLWNRLKGSHESAEASKKRVEDLIKEIADLKNTATRAEVEAVEAKLKALTADEQKLVTNSKKLLDLLADIIAKEEATEKEKQDALDKADADAVIKKIAELTDESTATEIAAVRAAYVALNENAKKLVSARTLELLTYYEARIEELIEIAQKEAAVVQDRINRITSSYTEAQIKNIRMAFNALSELAKTYITNLQKLIDAENNIIYQNTVVKQAKLDANAFDVYMNDINRNSTTAEIAKARAYYNRLSGEAKKHVTTYEKLVRLETMWKDPEYLDLVFTYYPEYIHAVKPGAIVVQKPTYDPLYIPDDSATTPTYPSSSVATNPVASWSAYETMRYQNGRYTTTISSTQVKNIADRNMRLKADNIEIVIPTADLKASTATVGVSINVSNDQLNIQFTEGNNAKYFSDYVEIHVPFSALKGNASQIIERVSAFGSAASFKVDGSTFIIRTKSSGTFRTATVTTYNDIPSGEQGTAIRELAKRGIQFDTTSRLSQSYKQVTKMDVALMIATALDLSSNAKSKYLDLESDLHVKRAQGLLEAGIMSGATSARFNPNGTITKQEAAIIIANMYRYLNQDLAKAYNNLNLNYGDIANLTLEARQSIAILELFGVVSGTGSFEPTEQLTRGEFAEIIYKALTAIDYL